MGAGIEPPPQGLPSQETAATGARAQRTNSVQPKWSAYHTSDDVLPPREKKTREFSHFGRGLMNSTITCHKLTHNYTDHKAESLYFGTARYYTQLCVKKKNNKQYLSRTKSFDQSLVSGQHPRWTLVSLVL